MASQEALDIALDEYCAKLPDVAGICIFLKLGANPRANNCRVLRTAVTMKRDAVVQFLINTHQYDAQECQNDVVDCLESCRSPALRVMLQDHIEFARANLGWRDFSLHDIAESSFSNVHTLVFKFDERSGARRWVEETSPVISDKGREQRRSFDTARRVDPTIHKRASLDEGRPRSVMRSFMRSFTDQL